MKITVLFFLAFFSLATQAQESGNSKTNKDFDPPMLMRSIGISFQSFDGLNSRVANRPEFKTLKDYAGSIEFGFMKVSNRFITDMVLSAGSSMSGDRDRKSSTYRFVGAAIDLGYDVVPNEKILLYPIVGIGGQQYMARFYKDNSAVPFDVVLASPDAQNNIRPVNFRNTFFTYRLGAGFAVKSPGKSTSTYGIQARYTGSFKDKAWKSSDNQELANAPKDGLSQFQISLIVTDMPMRKMGRK
ncbi:MAG: hypothetical protein ABIT58_06105 [Ferruginibacter sp.]